MTKHIETDLKRILALFAIALCLVGSVPASAQDTVGISYLNTGVSAGQVLQIVAPSTNKYGTFIRTLNVTAQPNAQIGLFADVNAPSPITGWVRNVIAVSGLSSGFQHIQTSPIYIQPGFGLWVMAQNGTGGSINITFDVVTGP